jgi:RNA polymerase sigma-70 factor (ECF subfamily)
MTTPGAETGALSFSELYRTHAGDVRRFALFLSGDPSLADDLVSETFIRMWGARSRVDVSTVKAYLFAIARNLYLQHRRRENRHAPLDDGLHDPRPSPHERASARDELTAVMAGLQALPELDRAAVLMRAEGDVSYEDIGRALGVSAAAAKVRVHRARLKLAAARQPAMPAEGETRNP